MKIFVQIFMEIFVQIVVFVSSFSFTCILPFHARMVSSLFLRSSHFAQFIYSIFLCYHLSFAESLSLWFSTCPFYPPYSLPAIHAGSKGNNINLQQIMGTVGQQNVSGERIGFGFRGRSLPHFTKHDVGHLSRGFVVNPFLRYVWTICDGEWRHRVSTNQ